MFSVSEIWILGKRPSLCSRCFFVGGGWAECLVASENIHCRAV